jgi:hypothetical protein
MLKRTTTMGKDMAAKPDVRAFSLMLCGVFAQPAGSYAPATLLRT